MGAEIVLHVDGFSLQRMADGVLRMRDVDLAEHLDYDRPRKIRELIERLRDADEIPGVHMRPAVGRIEIGPKHARRIREDVVNEYWLDEIEALLVVMQSDAPAAKAMRRRIAEVFRAALRQFEERESALRRLPAHIERWFLSPKALDFVALWPDSLVRELERLHGREWTGGRHPGHLKSTYPAIYKSVMSAPVAAKMMASNPDRDKIRHHQMITPEARPFVVAQLGIVESIARQSISKADFWARMDREYAGGMLQLPFGKAAS